MSERLYQAQWVLGFVEELVVARDPEHEFSDSFRSSRRSNSTRQFLLHTMAAKLRIQIGRKVRRMGGNAVLGYQQHFDLEGDSGIVARAYGTAVKYGFGV